MSSVASAQLLELRGITHGYGGARARDVDGHAVLRDVSLDVDRGRIIGICGPSGSGKSTLLRLCAGLERPRRGTVTADGAPVWAGSRHPRLPRPGWAGALFQNPGASLDPNWRVGRILDEPYTVRGRARPGADERHRRRAAALAEVGLDGLRVDLRPRQLSGGQQQRVALARLLLSAPDLIVADEPTSALDVTNAAAVMHVLHRAARAGAGIVLASHDLPLLASLCDEVWRCEDCRLARVHLREEAAR